MNISAILVVVPVERLDAGLEALGRVPGVEIHHVDPATGRLVITQEAETVHQEVAGLERIQALPDVVLAEMVSHYCEDDTEIRQGQLVPPSGVVPASLEDEPTESRPRAATREE